MSRVKKITSIVSGFSNIVFKSNEVEEIAKERLAICRNCPKTKYGKRKVCLKSLGGCGCYLPAKTRSLEEECPIGKWLPK